ncbi:MAG TPA: APC family permease [Candidatus Binatia bacterium]|nr:APC family permease [Candidatus Binatia bacterium]
MSTQIGNLQRPAIKVFVATSVMLTFISFWRAAAIVLSDLASSAYYVGGDAEKVIGKSAPWFVLAVMLFSYAVRAIYIESSAMFVRGGVYRVVKQAMGGTLAKLSVSALLFDYILTGPISSVAAGQYVAGFLTDTFHHIGYDITVPDNAFAAFFAVMVTLYFWWQNTQGIRESSERALQIMRITTAMVVMLIAWCVITLVKHPSPLPPLPSPATMHHDRESLGWLLGTWAARIPLVMLLVGFGHSVLAMSGEESLAQINREIEHPKLKNLEKTGLVIFLYSLFFTSLVSFFAVMIIPDSTRPEYFANLISGLAMHMVGPYTLRLVFQGFVVLVGALILAGAVNTAIVGANGVLSRMVEDGVLTTWFKKPHRRFGTSYRVINLIVGLQVFTIVASRGNVYLLASLYAFGVIWSFSFMSLAVLVLRYTSPENRPWKVPGNIHIRGLEIPLGVGIISVVLFSTAIVNLLTKQMATIAGVTFSLVFFAVLEISERSTAHEHATGQSGLEQFNIADDRELSGEAMEVRPGNILVAVRDPRNLYYLQRVLSRTDTTKTDVVVMTARVYHREHSFSGTEQMDTSDIFRKYEQELFTSVVSVAERLGKHVSLLVVPTNDIFDSIVVTAQRLHSSVIVCGKSNQLTGDEQGKLTGDAWERLPEPRPRLRLVVFEPSGNKHEYMLGPHTPRMRQEDVDLLHGLWKEVTSDPRYRELHHYHVLNVALQEMASRIHDGQEKAEVMKDIYDEMNRQSGEPIADDDTQSTPPT